MVSAATSATHTAHHIPSTPKSTGRISTDELWKTRVRRKDIAADTAPLFKAVKNPEAKILNPANTKCIE